MSHDILYFKYLCPKGLKMLSKFRKCETLEIHCDLGFQDFFDLIEVLNQESYREKIIFYFPLYFFENVFPKVSNRLFSEKRAVFKKSNLIFKTKLNFQKNKILNFLFLRRVDKFV